MNKKGLFFSLDALVALAIIFITLVVAYPYTKESTQQTDIHSDVLKTFSELKAGEVDSVYMRSLITQGIVSDSNKTVLEAIGETYVKNATQAKELASELIQDLTTQENIGVWYGSILLASKNKTAYETASKIDSARQIISGIREGESITGFSAKAFLSGKRQTKYNYFGGYVGDGNISTRVDFNGTAINASLELVASTNFSLYINNVSLGNYAGSPSQTQPINYTFPVNSFRNGTNIIELKGNNLAVTGGFIKIIYESDLQYEQPTRIYLPGIKGIINLYDGLSVPGTLQDMSAHLHYKSPYTAFLTIGNVTVFNQSNSNETTIDITNSQLSNILNYNQLSNNTTPIRLGLQNISLTGNGVTSIDVILITDVSGSMDSRMDNDNFGTARNCNDPLLYNPSTKRISLAKCLDKQFVETILNSTTNSRIALVSFSNDGSSYTSLTNNLTLLNNTITNYAAGGATCLSCAINQAYTILQTQSNSSRAKYIIAMTDGVANRRSTNTCADLYGDGGTSSNQLQASGINGIITSRQANGQFLNLQTGITDQLNDIDFYNSTFGFSLGNGGRIMKWNGASWSSVSSPLSSTLSGLDIWNYTFALGVGASGKVVKWNGTGWSNPASIAQNPTLNGISILNSTFAFAVGLRSSSGKVYKTTNGGTSWTEDYSNSQNLRGIKIINSTKAFAVGDNGMIAQWSGSSWSSVSSPTTEDLYGIDSANQTFAIAVGGNSGKAISIKWNGASWSSELDYAADSLRDVRTFGSTSYAVGDGGLIQERNNTGWTQNFNFPEAYKGNNTAGISCTSDTDSCTQEKSYPSLNANYSSCRAYNELNSTVYSIGFGPIETCGFASETLRAVANCGNGTFYTSSNATVLQQFYATIAQNIIKISFTEQTSVSVGNISTELFPDSYIQINYTKKQTPFGMLLSYEKLFSNASFGSVEFPQNASLIEVKVASYSGPRWTTQLNLNGNSAYNLTKYGTDYTKLGDPYHLTLPYSSLGEQNNITIVTGLSPTNTTVGSAYNKIIYTVVKNASGYSPIVSIYQGCEWQIEFDSGALATIRIPKNYTGSDLCYYKLTGPSYNNNDAAQEAVYRLLLSTDLNHDGRADVEFTPEDVDVTLTEVTGIPFTWSTEVQVRIWR